MTNEEILREIASLSPEGQRLVESFVAFLRQRYAPSQPVTQTAIIIRDQRRDANGIDRRLSQ